MGGPLGGRLSNDRGAACASCEAASCALAEGPATLVQRTATAAARHNHLNAMSRFTFPPGPEMLLDQEVSIDCTDCHQFSGELLDGIALSVMLLGRRNGSRGAGR